MSIPILIVFILSTSFTTANGQEVLVKSLSAAKAQFGVSASGALGTTNFEIQSANSKAIYSGFGLDLRLSSPIWQNEIMSINGDIGLRYLDASNNANSSLTKEFVRLTGPGLGLNINVYRLLVGVNYYFMSGDHYWVGNSNDELSYNMAILSTYAGIHFSISNSMQVLFSYSSSQGKIPNKKTKFASDAPFESNTFWIHLTYGSGETLSAFFERLFK